MTLGHQIGALDFINILELWMTCATLGTKLKTLYTMYDSGLSLTGMTLGHELRALDPIISLSLLIT